MEDIDTFRHYAIKREPTHIRNPQIQHESDMYDALAGGRKFIDFVAKCPNLDTYFFLRNSWYPSMSLAWST